jgi:hypothetical protein
MNRRVLTICVLAAGLALAGCGTDQSCASESASWVPGSSNTCSSIAAGQAFDVALNICQSDCQSAPSCGVEVDAPTLTILLDPIVHTCDANSCGVATCPTPNPVVTCRVPGLNNGTYSLVVGPDFRNAGQVTVGSGVSSCSI